MTITDPEMDLNNLTIDAARSAVAEGKISATALAQAYFTKIESDDPKIGAFLMLWPRAKSSRPSMVGTLLPSAGGAQLTIGTGF